MRANSSGTTFPSELRDLLQRRLGDLEKQLLQKVSSLEEEKYLLYNETTAHRQRTESTLNSLLERINELEKGTHTHTHDTLHTKWMLSTFTRFTRDASNPDTDT